jgi:hypothetical protein
MNSHDFDTGRWPRVLRHHIGLLRFVILVTLLAGIPLTASALPMHSNYAILFSGGYNAGNNHLRYYEETLRMWNITTNTLGFDVDKVYVLFADGTAAGADRTVGESRKNPDTTPAALVNSDWSAVTNANGIIRDGQVTTLENTFNEVAGRITANDSFYFWAFNHGSNASFAGCPNANSAPNDNGSLPVNHEETDLCAPNAPPGANVNDVSLTAWNQQSITDANFAGLAGLISAKNPMGEAYAFAECFSGGMADNLVSGRRFLAWAAAANECSFDRSWADAWADGLESGLRGTNDLGAYAVANDAYGGGPAINKETPGYSGYNHDIVTNLQIPLPSTLALLLAAAAAAGCTRLRKAA